MGIGGFDPQKWEHYMNLYSKNLKSIRRGTVSSSRGNMTFNVYLYLAWWWSIFFQENEPLATTTLDADSF